MNEEYEEYESKSMMPADIGTMVRAKRKQIKLTQVQTSAMCNVGTRFLSELENGKTTLELGKVLHVLSCLELEVSIAPKPYISENVQAMSQN